MQGQESSVTQMSRLIPNHIINRVSGIEGISYQMMSWEKVLQTHVLGVVTVCSVV